MQPESSYRGLKFPPYKHQEYPKWVGDKIVNSEAEELAALEKLTTEDPQKGKGNDRNSGAPNRK